MDYERYYNATYASEGTYHNACIKVLRLIEDQSRESNSINKIELIEKVIHETIHEAYREYKEILKNYPSDST